MKSAFSGSFLRLASLPEVISSLFRFPFREDHSAKLLWLVKLRWVAVFLFFLLALPGLYFGYLSADTIAPYLGTLALLLVFNLLTQLNLEAGTASRSRLLAFQLAFDLLGLTALLYLTGGIQSPLATLFFVNAAIGGLLLPGGLPVLLLTHACILALQVRSLLQAEPDFATIGPMLILHILLFASWVVMRSLGLHLERQHEKRTSLRLLAEKQDRLRAVGALAAGFSHEFASPLNAAKLRLERLDRQASSEDTREALAALRACEDVVRQMNSSQLDPRSFQTKRVNVAKLTEDIADTWREGQDAGDVIIDAPDCGHSLLPPLNFAQTLLNLLDNARQASPTGPVRVHLARQSDFFVLRVEDEGPGFLPNVIKQLGEPFVTSKAHGTGLGLYVSQLFAQSLGGELTVQNQERGARVTIRWPAKEEV